MRDIIEVCICYVVELYCGGELFNSDSHAFASMGEARSYYSAAYAMELLPVKGNNGSTAKYILAEDQGAVLTVKKVVEKFSEEDLELPGEPDYDDGIDGEPCGYVQDVRDEEDWPL